MFVNIYGAAICQTIIFLIPVSMLIAESNYQNKMSN